MKSWFRKCLKLSPVKFIFAVGYFGDEMMLLSLFNVATTDTGGDSGLDARPYLLTFPYRVRERKLATSAHCISRFFKASRLKMIIFRRMLKTFSGKRACRMIRRFLHFSDPGLYLFPN